MTSPVDVSPAVVACAAAHQLGGHQASFRRRPFGLVRLVSLCVLGIATAPLLIGFLFLYFALFVAPDLNRNQAAQHIHIFQDGLIVTDASGPADVFRWDALTAYQETISGYLYHNIQTTTPYTYKLVRPDGSNVKLSHLFERPDAWGLAIQRGILAAQLPRALATIRAGHTLAFGPLSVDMHGISLRDRTCRWYETSGISVSMGRLCVNDREQRSAILMIAVKKIPNVFVLASAVEEITAALPEPQR